MKKAHILFFDLDGTLVDTVKDLGAAVNTILARHHFPTHDFDEYVNFIGQGSRHLLEEASGITDPATLDTLYGEYLEDYLKNLCKRSSAYPHILAALEKYSLAGYEIFVFTNKPEEAAQNICRFFFKNVKFRSIISAVKKYPPKPNPTGLLAVIAEFNLDPQDIIYFGDSDYDMKVAAAVKIPYRIGCAYGYQDSQRLEEGGATDIILTSRQVYKMVDKYGFTHSYSVMILFALMEGIIVAIGFLMAYFASLSAIRNICLILSSLLAGYTIAKISVTLAHIHHLEPWALYGFTSAFIAALLFIYLFSGSFIEFTFANQIFLVLFIVGLLFALIFVLSFYHIVKMSLNFLRFEIRRKKYAKIDNNDDLPR